MSLIQLFQILMARRSIILVALLSCFLSAAAVAFFVLPSRYEARARIMLDVVEPDPVTGELMSGSFMEAYISTQAALIRDYQTMGAVVDKLGWTSNPIIIQQYDAEVHGPGQDIRRWLADGLSGATGIQLIPGSNILEIIHTAGSPEIAKGLVDLIRATYIEQSLAMRRENASRLADWFRQQGDQTLAEIKSDELEQANYAKESGILFQPNMRDLESNKLHALIRESVITATSPSFGGSKKQRQAQFQLDAVNQQIAQAAGTLGPNHPVYQSLLRQRQLLTNEAERQRANGDMGGSRTTSSEVQALLEDQKARVSSQHDELERLKLMQQRIKLKVSQYQTAMQKAADLRLEANAADAGLTSFGEPIAKTSRIYPNLPLILGGAVGLGTLIGIVTALLVEFLSLRVRCNGDLEFAAGVPVIGTIKGHQSVRDRMRHLFGRFMRQPAIQ